MSICINTFPRAGLIGNPSDGFFGRTIAFTFNNFQVDLTLQHHEKIRIEQQGIGSMEFDDVSSLISSVLELGHPEKHCLLTATIKAFFDHCDDQGIDTNRSGFAITFDSSIPYQLGFAGSSAIIVACLRALMIHYDVDIPPPELAALALRVEVVELGIAGGLQDRVTQVYQGLVYMDFAEELMKQQGHGDYRVLDPKNLPNLYIAYRTTSAEDSRIYHQDLRNRFNAKETAVLNAIACWRSLTWQAKTMIDQGDTQGLGDLMDKNFDQRSALYPISPTNLAMVSLAREQGASAKFTGSGGAIIGTYRDETMYQRLVATLADQNVVTFKPSITTNYDPNECQ